MSFKWVFSDFAQKQCENCEIELADIDKTLPFPTATKHRYVFKDNGSTYNVHARNGTIQSVLLSKKLFKYDVTNK